MATDEAGYPRSAWVVRSTGEYLPRTAAAIRADLEAQNAPAAEAFADIGEHFGLYPEGEISGSTGALAHLGPAPVDVVAALEVARLLALIDEEVGI